MQVQLPCYLNSPPTINDSLDSMRICEFTVDIGTVIPAVDQAILGTLAMMYESRRKYFLYQPF